MGSLSLPVGTPQLVSGPQQVGGPQQGGGLPAVGSPLNWPMGGLQPPSLGSLMQYGGGPFSLTESEVALQATLEGTASDVERALGEEVFRADE